MLLLTATCNELRTALAHWNHLNERLEKNLHVDKSEYIGTRLKIQDLERRLTIFSKNEGL